MITLYSIPDMERFLRTVDNCDDSVFLDLPGIGICDLKNDRNLRGMLQALGQSGFSGALSLSLKNSRDAQNFLNYMMG